MTDIMSYCCSTVGVKIMSIITFDVIMHCLCDAISNISLSSEVFVAVAVVVFRRDPLIFMFLFTHRVRCEMTTSKSLTDTTKDR